MLPKREGLAQVAFFDGLEKKLLQKARPLWARPKKLSNLF